MKEEKISKKGQSKWMRLEYKIIKTNRKTIAIQIKPDKTVVVRAPKHASDRQIRAFVVAKTDWINGHLETMPDQPVKTFPDLTDREIAYLKKKARQIIPQRVEKYAPIIGVDYGRISIRYQKTRWGSCSSKGNLNFNCFLAMAPLEVIDSIVVHELCHRKEMNHSRAFYDQVYRVYPQYDDCQKWLKSWDRSKVEIPVYN